MPTHIIRVLTVPNSYTYPPQDPTDLVVPSTTGLCELCGGGDGWMVGWVLMFQWGAVVFMVVVSFVSFV